MKRLHLFEFEDQQWFPGLIRNYMTDYLQFVTNQADFYKNTIPILERGLRESGMTTIIDLASGGGGGWKKLAPRLQSVVPDLRVVLTDYYPNIPAFRQMAATNPEIFSFEEQPVDALQVPPRLKGLRTQFLSFHHFRPGQAKQILQNAVDANAGIIIIEAQERKLSTLLQFALSPIFVLLATPFIRPFKWSRLLLTYLPPIIPLFVWWDGLVSVLRTYTIEEMQELTRSLNDAEDYEWKISKVENGPVTLPYLIGYPRA